VNMKVEGEKNLYWECHKGNKSIRIVYTDECVIGFNLMGIRYRQEVCEKWIREKFRIEKVLENLGEANFDPEFFSQYENELVQKFNSQHPGKNILMKRKRKLFNSLFNNSVQ